MKIQYQKIENGLEILRIWQDSGIIKVPEQIEGIPVIRIAPYTFSLHKDEEEKNASVYQTETDEEDDRFAQPEELCCGGMVREIHLPSTVQSIGNYAFYGCMNLKLFHGTDAIVRMGSGVFTGCRLEKVEIDFMDGNKSCLKEILTEIRYQIIATLRYQGTETKILFPEYYADAVENTPARIVETHYYGSGGEYRECFYRRKLDYGKYDRLFALSEARDSEEAIFSVALTRLRYPWKLEDAAKLRYENYVKAHMEEIGESCIHAVKERREIAAGDPQEVLLFCCREHYFDEQALGKTITYAADAGQTEISAILMDERYRSFPKKKKKFVSYAKWGYIFLIPFFAVYIVFSLIPLISTFYNSFFENYMVGLMQVGPKFVGFDNYKAILFNGDTLLYLKNTMIMWLMGFIPQILISLLLASWFTDLRLRLKCTGFFKTIIYMPNLIMASAFAMLFFTLFSDSGPINSLLMQIGFIDTPYKFLSNAGSTRGLVAFMNCLMWFGNTTILLMAGMMGIDTSLFEAAEVDGATSMQVFFKITLPLLRPILVYVLITSLIGGLQLFDVPQILTNGTGDPMRSSMTLIMFLNKHLYSKNYGMAGALSVVLFFITGVLSLVVFKVTGNDKRKG